MGESTEGESDTIKSRRSGGGARNDAYCGLYVLQRLKIQHSPLGRYARARRLAWEALLWAQPAAAVRANASGESCLGSGIGAGGRRPVRGGRGRAGRASAPGPAEA